MELIASNKYKECVLQGKESMSTYFDENNITWDYEKRLSIYLDLELYEVTDKEFIGYVAFRETVDEFFLADIQIFEEFRNKGYGTKILDKAKQIAKDLGHKQIMLKAFKASPAIRLYERNGFSKIAEEEFVDVYQSNT